ncbi:MAG: hypothetical protein WCJ01_02460 [Ignavibacteria bacterium]
MKSIFVILLLSFTIISCDILSTREPETPQHSRANYVPSTTPEALIQNLVNSFKDRIPENYASCFSANKFQFSPSAESASMFMFLLSWDLQSEKQYFNNLINTAMQNSQIILNFSSEEKNLYGDSVSYTAVYSLSVPFTDDQKPKFYQGNVHYTFSKENNNWVISYWADIKDEKYPCWSELKGRLN